MERVADQEGASLALIIQCFSNLSLVRLFLVRVGHLYFAPPVILLCERARLPKDGQEAGKHGPSGTCGN